jgi:hypothetical protein
MYKKRSPGGLTPTNEPSGVTVISQELATQAVAVLQEFLDGNRQATKADLVRHRSAESLVRLFQAQVKFSPERIAELARKSAPSEDVRNLANLTVDELNALTEQMLGQAG